MTHTNPIIDTDTADADHRRQLRGRPLRFVLTAELIEHRTLTVAQMVRRLAAHGFVLNGRASKVISDALRWEIRRGRVRRAGRGIYAYATAPRSTKRRIRRLASTAITYLQMLPAPSPTSSVSQAVVNRHPAVGAAAATSGGFAAGSAVAMTRTQPPAPPPWRDLNWLWTS